jgi:hypothetical protein
MKKLFSIFAVCAAGFATITASAHTTVTATPVKAANSASVVAQTNSSLRALSCDTLFNLNFATADSSPYYDPIPAADGEGYLDGNGSLNFGSGYLPITGVGEEYAAPGATGQYVTAAIAFFLIVDINSTDSSLPVTAYVYDATGMSAYGGVGPGNAIDSATTTLGAIVQANFGGIPNSGAGFFSFTHQAILPGQNFFIGIALPQTAGDTLAIAINDGTSGNGKGYINVPGNGGWTSYDSLTGGNLVAGNWIYASVCSNAPACPTIVVTATEVSNTTSASVTATGGVAPYTYHWSNGQTTDTATGLTNNTSYSVTVSDANGCTGTATASISTGIAQINAGVTNFTVSPNPSNGVFTATISLVEASDVNVSVLDLTGNKLYESTDKDVKDLSKSINLSTIAAGIYIVNVKTAQGSVNQRIVVK